MGFPFQKFFAVLQLIAPVILMAVPGASGLAGLVPIIVKGVADAETKPGATGDQKKAYVMQLVQDAALGANTVKPGTVDTTLVTAAASEAVDAVVGSVNAVLLAHQHLPQSSELPAPTT